MEDPASGAGAELRRQYEEDGFLYPAYGDRCFADVPESALSLLSDGFHRGLPASALAGLDDVETVVVALLDGFGLDQWSRLADRLPLVRAFQSGGTVTPLTSIYPSETAAAVTTMATGLLPAQHGLLGWYQYLESVGEPVQPLPFTTVNGTPVQERHPAADPSELFDGEPVYLAAADDGIESHVVQSADVAEGAYSRLTSAGATTHAGWNAVDMALDVRDVVAGADEPTYVYLYLPNVDTIAHRTGPGIDRYDAQVRLVTEALRTGFVESLDPETAAETALLVTADHGHLQVDPAGNPELDRPDVWELLRRGDDGEPVPPVGSPRNVQFHVRPGRVDELRNLLEGEFDVVTFTEAEYRERGLFGRDADGKPVDTGVTFDRRAPDLVAVHRDRHLWHEHDDKRGVHGGLSHAEMLVPFAAGRVSDLQD